MSFIQNKTEAVLLSIVIALLLAFFTVPPMLVRPNDQVAARAAILQDSTGMYAHRGAIVYS